MPSYMSRETVKELYFGRWTRESGWQATVYDFPRKLSDGTWVCTFKEVGSDALVMAITVRDISALRPGDAAVVHTDGVTEAMNLGEEFYTTERLNADFAALCNGTPEAIVRAIKDRVDAFTGTAPKADDVTLLALRWHTPAS